MKEFSLVPLPAMRDRMALLIAHGGPVLAWFLAPLVVFLLRRGDRHVEFHALQSLLWSVAGTVVALATCGVAIPVFMVWHILAAVKTANGEEYEYPLVGEFARQLLS
jgi:uncharacterized membrane protein